jgi:hypothetical protein
MIFRPFSFSALAALVVNVLPFVVVGTKAEAVDSNAAWVRTAYLLLNAYTSMLTPQAPFLNSSTYTYYLLSSPST